MDKKPYAFLGQYLVGNGLITGDQLADAIHLQKENNALIGTIALAQGFLDKRQLNHLIRRQLKVDERIGKLAVDEDFMTEEQLEAVLSVQANNHLYLGESLIRLGTISHQSLHEALKDFETQIVSQEKQLREEISHLPVAKELFITLDITLRFFYRLGYAIRIVGMGGHLPDRIPHLYCSEQIFKNSGIGYMGVGMSSMLVESIGQGSTLSERPDGPDTDAMENTSQLIFNLNYLVCKEMKKRGIRVKHGAAFIGMPPSDHADGPCFEMETITSPMVLTYSDGPAADRPLPIHLGLLRQS